jgi:hypothetical protein
MKTRFMVLGLLAALCLAGAGHFTSASGQTPTPTSSPEPSPTPTSGPLGSISGRVYVDVNNDGTFGGPDVPLSFPLDLFLVDITGPVIATGGSSANGAYEFADLPPGNYFLFVNLPIVACAVPVFRFDWVGEPPGQFSCGNPQLSTPSRTVNLGAGQSLTNIDFPQVPASNEIAARIWLNAAPLSPQHSVRVTAGGNPCWSTAVTTGQTLANVPVSRYSARLEPLDDPRCHNGNLDLQIDSQSLGISKPWDEFWRESLLPLPARPLGWQYDPAIPPFLGISGQAIEAGTVTPQNVSRHEGALLRDGTEIQAFVGATLCGTTLTKTLTGPAGLFGGNLFGLVVPPASVKSGCGTPGATVSFCVGDFKAQQPASGPFSYFQSPEAKPVQWAAPALADITLEPTNEPCLPADPRAPDPKLPISLPLTGGPPE